MPICDVCNSKFEESEGTRYSATIFRKLLDMGFGVTQENIKMLMETGIAEESAKEILREEYKKYTTDWLCCPRCEEKVKNTLSKNHEF